MTEVLLDARNIGKRFGGVHALKDVSLTIRRGEIYGLIGPNGAGKTTLFNVFTGLYPRDGGAVLFAGAPLDLRSPHRVAAAGIARTFQNIRLFGNMTALENVMVGRHVRTRAGVVGAILRTAAERAEETAIRRRADELLHYVGIADRARDLARHLSYATVTCRREGNRWFQTTTRAWPDGRATDSEFFGTFDAAGVLHYEHPHVVGQGLDVGDHNIVSIWKDPDHPEVSYSSLITLLNRDRRVRTVQKIENGKLAARILVKEARVH
jgi:hypothetical protein